MPVFRRDGRNVLFIHVPKCGGSSVERAFRASGYQAQYLDGNIGPGTINSVRACTPQHMHAAMLEQIFAIERFDAVFMIVRDPLARFRSEYVWRHRDQTRLSARSDDVARWAAQAFRQFREDPFVYDNHIRPQEDFWLPRADVYHLEDGLESIVGDLNSRFDFGVVLEPARAKDSESEYSLASQDVELSETLRADVQEFYRRDYVRFGYGSGLAARTQPVIDRWRASGLEFRRRVTLGARSVVTRLKR